MPGLALLATSPPLLSAALAAAAPLPVPTPPLAAQPSGVAPLAFMLTAAQDEPPPPAPALPQDEAPGEEPMNEIVVEGDYGPPKGDPAEAINAESYRITQAVDAAVIEPVAYAYRDGLPEPIRDGLGNVVRNLGEPANALNFLLQGKVGKAFGALGRLAINSTLGVGGLFDVAEKPGIGIPYRDNGFANTLGYYGVGPGPYLYLPVTGATSVRDLIGNTLDQALLPLAVGKPFNRPEYAVSYFVVNGLDERLELDAELSAIRASDDPYAERRDTYLAMREREIAALKGETVAAPEPGPQAEAPEGPPLSLVEQVQLTARAAPPTR